MFGLYTRLRSWDTFGECFPTAEARSASLRAFAEEVQSDDEEIADDASDSDLIDLVAGHDHDVFIWDSEIEIPGPVVHVVTTPFGTPLAVFSDADQAKRYNEQQPAGNHPAVTVHPHGRVEEWTVDAEVPR